MKNMIRSVILLCLAARCCRGAAAQGQPVPAPGPAGPVASNRSARRPRPMPANGGARLSLTPPAHGSRLRRALAGLQVIAALCCLAGCGRPDTPVPDSMQDAATLTLEMLGPAETIAGLRIRAATAWYAPVERNAATTTARWHFDCGSPAHIPVPRLPEPCVTHRDELVSRPVPALDRLGGPDRTARAALAQRITQGRDAYQLQEVAFLLERCAGGRCTSTMARVEVLCEPQQVARVVVLGQVALGYAGAGCGWMPAAAGMGGLWTEADIVGRIRDHFPSQGHSHLLPSALPLLPTPGGAWLVNPIAPLAERSFQDLCPLPQGMSVYRRVEFDLVLPPRAAWPSGGKVAVLAYLRQQGQVCAIDVGGEVGDEPRYRQMRYAFAGGRLVQVEASIGFKQPRETWRYFGGLPLEYVRESEQEGIAGSPEIWYWHAVAAKAWPDRMHARPDLNTFNDHARLASELMTRAGGTANPDQPQ